MFPSRAILWPFARTYWGVAAFLGGFLLLLLVVSHFFLLPALDAARDADAHGRRQLQAVSWLVLTILLLYVVAGLILAFRVGRFFFPRKTAPRVKTTYVDAWAEAGRRVKADVEDEERPSDGAT